MQSKTIIMMGPQGSGKGTQLNLLDRKLRERGEVLRIETGKAFRSLMDEEGYTASLVRAGMKRGEIQPLFLSITLWGALLKEHMHEGSHVLIDGFPRRLREAEVLHSAMQFYGREVIDVVVLNLSEEAAVKRMQNRGRADDTPQAMRERLSWYQETVVPAIEWYRNQTRYAVHDIDADHSVEEVADEIASALTLT